MTNDMTDGLTSSNEDEEINNVSYCLLNYVNYIRVRLSDVFIGRRVFQIFN